MTESPSDHTDGPSLARRLSLFDATMIVMGGIIGAGIFVNPSVVAQRVDTPALVLCAWLIGGLIALIGAFVYAEPAAALIYPLWRFRRQSKTQAESPN